MRTFLKWAIFVIISIVFLLFLDFIFANTADWSQVRVPTDFPTTCASPKSLETVLVVVDHAPAVYRPSHYEYIMPQDQQRRILKSAQTIRYGEAVDSVIKKLGPPLYDQLGWGKPQLRLFLPRRGIIRPTRCLDYYFAKRRLNLSNGFDPCVELFFDKDGKLTWLTSDIDGISEVGGYAHRDDD